MNAKTVLILLAKLNPARIYQAALYTGDVAYKTNRSVVRMIDINQDTIKGKLLAKRLVKQIDAWIKALETLRDASKRISEEAAGQVGEPRLPKPEHS